jgi:hypothetical protein
MVAAPPATPTARARVTRSGRTHTGSPQPLRYPPRLRWAPMTGDTPPPGWATEALQILAAGHPVPADQLAQRTGGRSGSTTGEDQRPPGLARRTSL